MTMKKISNTSKVFDADKSIEYGTKNSNIYNAYMYYTDHNKWVESTSASSHDSYERNYCIVSVEHATAWFLTNGYKEENIPKELHKYINDCIV